MTEAVAALAVGQRAGRAAVGCSAEAARALGWEVRTAVVATAGKMVLGAVKAAAANIHRVVQGAWAAEEAGDPAGAQEAGGMAEAGTAGVRPAAAAMETQAAVEEAGAAV